jgi:hypothetical protein
MRETDEQFRRFVDGGKRLCMKVVPIIQSGEKVLRCLTQLFNAQLFHELANID